MDDELDIISEELMGVNMAFGEIYDFILKQKEKDAVLDSKIEQAIINLQNLNYKFLKYYYARSRERHITRPTESKMGTGNKGLIKFKA